MANWKLIKEKYISGEKPSNIAKEFKIRAGAISERASREEWTQEKAKECKKNARNYKEKVQEITNLALEALERKLNQEDPETQAIKAALDISGLKRETSHLDISSGKFSLFYKQVEENAKRLRKKK
jgi:hypothetical protein